MADTPVVVVPTDSPSSADVEAARAAASATTAAEAAAATIAMADATAARTGQDAAERLAAIEGRMTEWQSSLTSSVQTLQEAERLRGESEARASARLEQLERATASILDRLEPEPQPSQTTPATSPPAGDQPASEPAPPPRKRAHRWT
jgi:hypothetical protein